MSESASFLTVTEISLRIKEGLEALFPYSLSIKGEISNFRIYGSGHAYFSLKDDSSVISCVMWASSIARMRSEGGAIPKDGDEVIVGGRLTSYPARGSYQLSVFSISPYGKGDALLKLEELKKKLAAEGLFDESRKRPIARFPKKIGVIAGEGSAGMKDIVFNITKRWPMAELLLFPSLVQGEGAPKALIQAFKKAQDAGLDTLIIGRGGGSSEDLGAFNDEALVREVATSHCPVISAVGHEIDVTLLDYVADLRVSTPTGAAVAATPDQNEIRQGIDSMEERLQKALEARLGHIRVKLDLISQRSFFLRPEAVYEPAKEKVAKASEHLMLGTKAQLDRKTSQLSVLSGKLSTLNPYAVLSRGYGITQTSSGKVLTSVQDVGEGEQIQTRLKDGMITATVLKKEQKDGK